MEEFDFEIKRKEFVGKLIEFLEKVHKKDIGECISNEKPLILDLKEIDIFDHEIAELLYNRPDNFFDILKEALDHVAPGEEIRVEIRGAKEIMIRDLRAIHIGKYICIEGIVRRASEIRPRIIAMLWKCVNCNEVIKVEVNSNIIRKPVVCDCGSKQFVEQGKEMIDTRRIMIEEPFELTEGEKPSQIGVVLSGELVSKEMRSFTNPGNRIKVYGILRDYPIGRKSSINLDFLFEAKSFVPVEAGWKHIKITKEDEKKILELSKRDDIYDIFINSLAPTIYGLREIKEAIVLQMFGGIERVIKNTRIRGEIHILLIGDPASGKSQLLKLVPKLVPRGKYVSGKGVTGAGLTATVTRDEQFMGGWVLEAGALVLANKGLIAIDEFEKMSKDDQVAMHEALEQGTISIAKASIVATLPAKTAVLAGGNPVGSRIDAYSSISKQINIPPPILSRFDLKFILRDVPNIDLDKRIIEHIIKMRKDEYNETNLLEPEFIRKYIAYSKQNCEPVLSKEAEDLLKNFYLEMRNASAVYGTDTPQITLRQFEALIRLSEASARVQLSNVVRKEDAERAIKLMKFSLENLGISPETGLIDIDKFEGGTTMSEKKKMRKLMEIIDRLSEENREIQRDELKKVAIKEGLDSREVDEIISEFEKNGIIFSPSPGFIQKVE